MDEIKAKQQVVEKIKEASKILVTVSDSPSVDALSAALGLTMILDKQEKYATAIFSGETPPAIAFLEPEKTFDDTTDSLRDFIIALNKEKADHLRYKVEGESVKIFITPYKTTINQDDLEFSQGDYNVELVIALGVDNQEHLDNALDNHGQILHDAAIVTLSVGDQYSSLGGVDWHDDNASSLSEMVAGLAEALKEDKKKSLLDKQISTALLTGVVAQTDRFSNEHTTSKVMTVAASLMAAGADQQLIANELQQAHTIEVTEEDDQTDDTTDQDGDTNDDATAEAVEEPVVKKDPTRLSIEHEDDETLAELDKRVLGEDAAREKIEDEIEAIQDEAEEVAGVRELAAIDAARPKVESLKPQEDPAPSPAYAIEADETEPTFGGILNATADQAEEDKRRAIEDDQNRTILSHASIGEDAVQTSEESTEPSAPSQPLEATTAEPAGSDGFPGTPSVAPGSVGVNATESDDTVHSSYASEEASPALGGLNGEKVIQPLEQAAQELAQPQVPAASFDPFASSPSAPTAPTDFGLPLPPPIPDFSQGLPPAPNAAPQPAILGDILAPEPQSPELNYEATNTVPAPGTAYAFDETPSLPPIEPIQPPAYETPQAPVAPTPPSQPPAANPGQFQIPGQQ